MCALLELALKHSTASAPCPPQDPEDIARKALKEAARELERKEAALRDDHTIAKGGMAAAAQVCQ